MTGPVTTGVHWVDVALVWIGVISVSSVAIVFIKSHVVPFFRSLTDFLGDWAGERERPGVPRVPGVMERLRDLETGQSQIVKQVNNNGGSSLKDAVDRVERSLNEHITNSDELQKQGIEKERALWEAVGKLADNATPREGHE